MPFDYFNVLNCHSPPSCSHIGASTQQPQHTMPDTAPSGPLRPPAAHAMGSCDAPRATQTAVWPLLSELVSTPGRGPSPKYEEYAPRSTARSRRDVAMSSSGVPY